MTRRLLPWVLLTLVFASTGHATVGTTSFEVTYTGNGGSTFAVPFPFLATSHLAVVQTTIATGVEDTLVENQHYTVARNSSSTGVVTTTSSVSSAYTITITRVVPLTQTTSFKSQGTFSPASHESAFDKITMALQQIAGGIGQSQETSDALNTHIGSADDHVAYAKLPGRAGGQVLQGGTASGEDLTLQSTAHATKGMVYFGSGTTYYDEAGDDLTIGDALSCTGDAAVGGAFDATGNATFGGYVAVGSTPLEDGVLFTGYIQGKNGLLLGTSGAELVINATDNAYCDGAVYIGNCGSNSGILIDEASDTVAMPTLYGTTTAAGQLFLGSTSHATKGLVNVASTIWVDETNSRVGILDNSPDYELDVLGDVSISGTIYGSESASGSLELSSTAHATKGNITLGSAAKFDETNTRLHVGSELLSAGTTPLNISHTNTSSGPVAHFFTDGNNLASVGVKIQAGLDTPASTADIVWVELYDGNGDQVSEIQYLSSGAGAQFAVPSDARLKRNIEPTDVQGLATINAIPLRQYDWKDGKKPHVALGYVAQEVKDVWPPMVGKGADGLYKVGDASLVPVLVKAVQELSAQVEALEQQLNEQSAGCGW